MASSIQDILYAQALADAEKRVDPAVAMGGGAAVGAALGAAAGTIPHNIGKVFGAKPGFRPGFRMAGGLVGAVMGGVLGEGIRSQMVQESDAAGMLAKLQAKGQLDVMDQMQLEQVLKGYYNNPGSFA